MRELNDSVIKVTDIVCGALMASAAAAIAVMAICGYEKLANVWLIIVLSALVLSFLFTAAYQRNPVALWLCGVAASPLIVEIAVLSGLEYSTVYPVYVAAPAIAFMLTGIFFRRQSLVISAILFVFADIFALSSCGVLRIGIALPIVVVYLIAMIVLIIITEKKR